MDAREKEGGGERERERGKVFVCICVHVYVCHHRFRAVNSIIADPIIIKEIFPTNTVEINSVFVCLKIGVCSIHYIIAYVPDCIFFMALSFLEETKGKGSDHFTREFVLNRN